MIITQTPLRVSFLGGNTDFESYFKKHGGCVLTTAIDKYVYCIITERFDDEIRVNWSKKEIVNSVDQLEHELVREAMKKVGVKKGVEITFLADIPSEGSGLGSSSSVLVGVLNALYHYIGETPTEERLAREACEIEIGKLKKPIGIQDQYIAAYGGLRFLEFQKSGKVIANKVDIPKNIKEDFDNGLMMFYTGKTRKSSTILTTVSKNIKTKEQILDKTKQLAKKGYAALVKGDIHLVAELLNDYWILKKQMSSGISDPEIDKMYADATAAGAVGGKILGAGGGGFMLLMVPSHSRAAVRKALSPYKELPFHFEKDGSKVILNISRN